MDFNKLVNPIRNNLRNNLWNLINKKPLDIFNFIEYLEIVLIKTHRKIIPHDFSLLLRYRNQFNEYYVELLDFINREIYNADVMEMERQISKKVNGSFSSTLKNFLKEYDETN